MGFFFKSVEEKLREREMEAERRMDRAQAEVLAGRRSILDAQKAQQEYYGARLDRQDYDSLSAKDKKKIEKENSVLHKIVGWPF